MCASRLSVTAADTYLSCESAFLHACEMRDRSSDGETASSSAPSIDELKAWDYACDRLCEELLVVTDDRRRDTLTVILFFCFGFLKRDLNEPPRCLCCWRREPSIIQSHAWSESLLTFASRTVYSSYHEATCSS